MPDHFAAPSRANLPGAATFEMPSNKPKPKAESSLPSIGGGGGGGLLGDLPSIGGTRQGFTGLGGIGNRAGAFDFD